MGGPVTCFCDRHVLTRDIRQTFNCDTGIYYVKSILLKTSFLNMYLKHTKLCCFHIFCCNFPPRSLSLNFILNLMYKVGGGGDNHMNLKTTNVKPLQFYVIISKSL